MQARVPTKIDYHSRRKMFEKCLNFMRLKCNECVYNIII